MGTRSEFYQALDIIKEGARKAMRVIPDDLNTNTREGRLCRSLLTRLPEQIDDLRTFLDDPHKATDPSERNPIVIP